MRIPWPIASPRVVAIKKRSTEFPFGGNAEGFAWVIENDDAIALRDIERSDDTAEFDDARGLLTTLTLGLAAQVCAPR